MMIPSMYPDTLQKIESDEPISNNMQVEFQSLHVNFDCIFGILVKNLMSMILLTCSEIIFLAMSIFRHTIFGNGLLVFPNIFGVFLFFKVIAIFGMSIFSRAIFSRCGHHAR